MLGLTLTSRDKTIPMAGFPHHQLEPYLQKLLHLGYRVAVCDQVEDAAAAKGLVKRDVTRVVTPGTITEDDLLDPRAANLLVALYPDGPTAGVAWVELSTGQFHAADVPWTRVGDELQRLAPAECLCAEKEDARAGAAVRTALPTAAVSLRPDWNFDALSARKALQEHFGVLTMSGFGFDDGQLLSHRSRCAGPISTRRRSRPVWSTCIGCGRGTMTNIYGSMRSRVAASS